MSLREAILADQPRLHRETEHGGRINIQDGTKGGCSGASAPRWVVANEEVKAALQLARQASPSPSPIMRHATSLESFAPNATYLGNDNC